MASNRFPLIPLLLAPFSIWLLVQRFRQYRAERATSESTAALRAERWLFRGLGWAGIWLIFAFAAMVNPTTPDWLMIGIWCGTGVGVVVSIGAAFAAGMARTRERYERDV